MEKTAPTTTMYTVSLREDHARALEQEAQQAGMSAEDLLRQHLEAWLDGVKAAQEEFEEAAAYVLRKNSELYRRLS